MYLIYVAISGDLNIPNFFVSNCKLLTDRHLRDLEELQFSLTQLGLGAEFNPATTRPPIHQTRQVVKLKDQAKQGNTTPTSYF